jgi:hypothetical protein
MPCHNNPLYLLGDVLHQLHHCLAARAAVFFAHAEDIEVKRMMEMRRARRELDDANLLVSKERLPRVRCAVAPEPIENQNGKSGRGKLRPADSERIWKKSSFTNGIWRPPLDGRIPLHRARSARPALRCGGRTLGSFHRRSRSLTRR